MLISRFKKPFCWFALALLLLCGLSYGWYRLTQPWVEPAARSSAEPLAQAQPERLRRNVTELSTQHARRNVEHLPELGAAALASL